MSTRREFFLKGGVAAVATTAGMPALGEARVSPQELSDARDREAIREALGQLFADKECWQDLSRRTDVIAFHGGERATATVHFEAEQCTPLEGDCTAAQMARLQGNVASRQWVARCVEVDLAKIEGEWTIAGVRDRA